MVQERRTLHTQLERRINTPLTSSVGRLFDAAAALSGVRHVVNYEAQAAIEFEALADQREEGAYPFAIRDGVVDAGDCISALLEDLLAGKDIPTMSARFHNGLAETVLAGASRLRDETGIEIVALSGGVWQNITLLGRTLSLLEEAGFKVYIHREVPTNDGGLSLGQAAVAAWKVGAQNVPGRTGKNR
jgi:hydrogenase maturation protein HypF